MPYQKPGGFHQLKGSPCSNLLLNRAVRRKQDFCSSESWQQGEPSTLWIIYEKSFQVQVVADSELDSEEMQTIVGSLQWAVKPRDGADKDARRVRAKSVFASAAPSKLSRLCALLAWQVQNEFLSKSAIKNSSVVLWRRKTTLSTSTSFSFTNKAMITVN